MKTTFEELTWIAQVVLRKDERAFKRLVDRHQQNIRRFFLMQSCGDAALSDDLAQETFIRAWQHLSGFRQAAAFSTWLYRIAYHIWLDHCKKQQEVSRRDLWREDENLHHEMSEIKSDENAEEQIIKREKEVWLRQGIAQLNENERSCITLFYLEELSIRDICRITEMSESHVKVSLYRGRIHLKEILNTPSKQ